jgi:hypothetical protein
MSWEETLQSRLDGIRGARASGVAVSIKVRATGGCFHREHSPGAYRLIDRAVQDFPSKDGRFEEHESGPEILVLFGVTTAALVLIKSVVDLVTTIIKARTEGQKKGDHPREPLELIVRGFGSDGKMYEEKVLRIDAGEEVSRAAIEKALGLGLQKQLPKKQKDVPVKPSAKQKPKKRRR